MKPEVIKAALELVERYNTITLEEIESKNCSAESLTGFGSIAGCTLCQATRPKFGDPIPGFDCRECIYYKEGPYWFLSCKKGENRSTYSEIRISTNAEELQQAFRNRAEHITKILKEKGILV